VIHTSDLNSPADCLPSIGYI